MDLHHEFEVGATVQDVWPAFLDMPRLAPCMPGAEITEVIDERNVKGAAKVKVGPVNLRFAGTGQMTDVDDDGCSALLRAKGSDAKGRGNADADIRFQLSEARGNRTTVDVTTSLRLTGSVAQYGRASGLIDEIANQLIAEFVQNLEAELAPPTGSGPAPAAGPDHPAGDRTGTDGLISGPPGSAEAGIGSSGAVSDRPETPSPSGPQDAKAVSALRVFFRALLAMINKRLGRS